jgi:hypothetical protein
MKKIITLLLAITVLLCTAAFATPQKQARFILSFDAGIPLKILAGRYDAIFGNSFLALSGQAHVAGNFYGECYFAFYPEPRSGDKFHYNNDGFELAVNGLWKFRPMKKINPFVKIGLSYAWINSNNAWREIYYPDAGRERDTFLGLNAGGGIEYQLSRTLLLRLGAILNFVPRDAEGGFASWGKIFAGIGFRI